MKLNIGCTSIKAGRYRTPEWVNLDLQAHVPGLVQGDARKLPFRDGVFDEVHCIHMLEHVNRHDHSVVLKEIFRALAAGGMAYIEVPDWSHTVKLAYEAFQREDWSRLHDWHTSMYGKQRFPGDYHLAGFWPRKLARLMLEAGFTQILHFVDEEDMISGHYKVEPVILMGAFKP